MLSTMASLSISLRNVTAIGCGFSALPGPFPNWRVWSTSSCRWSRFKHAQRTCRILLSEPRRCFQQPDSLSNSHSLSQPRHLDLSELLQCHCPGPVAGQCDTVSFQNTHLCGAREVPRRSFAPWVNETFLLLPVSRHVTHSSSTCGDGKRLSSTAVTIS